MSHVAHPHFRPLKVDVRGAGLEIGPLAVAALRDIETLLEQSLGEAVGVGDLGRDYRVAVGVELRYVFLQAKLTDCIPCAIKCGLGPGYGFFRFDCRFCHDSSSSPAYVLHSTPSRPAMGGAAYHSPVFAMLAHGSAGGRGPSFCKSSTDMLSGERTKAMYPSRGGRWIVIPASINDWHSA